MAHRPNTQRLLRSDVRGREREDVRKQAQRIHGLAQEMLAKRQMYPDTGRQVMGASAMPPIPSDYLEPGREVARPQRRPSSRRTATRKDYQG